MSTNKLVTCPYDEAHKVKESRLQVHITKCKRNHLTENEEKFTCPFNASHVLNKPERSYHLQNCPDRAPVDRKLCQSLDRNNPFKGRTAVPSYNESTPVISEELWDADVNVSSSRYTPSMEAPVGAIIEPPPYSKPAERRKLYQELHRLPVEREPKQTQPMPVQCIPREPKQPTEASKIEMLRRENMEHYQGLGRGKFPVHPSRIAANIFSPPAHANPGMERSYSAAMSSGLSQFGIGRGQSNRAADPDASIYQQGYNSDFPSLGFGRGISRNSNGVNAPRPR